MTATTQTPSQIPAAAGRPCWSLDDVARAIPQVAQLDASRAHYFLASHTPIRGLSDKRTGQELDEEALYQAITSRAHGDVLALVHGEPGTGKSHLIHWLNLRLRHALETGETRGVLPVLVQRRTGSLRDALDQIVTQLPSEFAHYTTSIRQAIEHISAETARQQLANELRLELGVRRPDRGRPVLAGELRNLHETVGSPGFRDWLCREGGPIDRNIRRLNTRSDVEDRASLPPFTARDFVVEDGRFKKDNTPAVRTLIDDLEDEPELREQAAAHFNEVLPDALAEVTGLGGATLRELFDNIRADLRKQGRVLAVFVEDVSVMSVLDQDVVNVFEPQRRDDLCRTIAVIGLTEPGMKKLRDNQRERPTHEIAVGKGVGTGWTGSEDEVARFTARYLNALRLPEDGVREIARVRRPGGVLTASACDGCPVRGECHAAFGSVEVDGVQIGTFPFSARAPQRLMSRLNESEGVRRNPRGLLMHVVHPVVASHATLEEGRFPQVHLAVSPPALPFWSAFEERFCGGWTVEEKNRLRLLTQFWVDAESADDAAERLQPFLSPLSFPAFTAAASSTLPRRTEVRPEDTRTRAEEASRPGVSAARSRLEQLLAELDRWASGDELPRPTDAREFLAKLIRNSIPWEDQRDIPLPLAREMTRGYEWVDIEGMRVKLKNPSAFSVRFPRSAETRELIEAIAQYEFVGRGSWNFEHGELHKRRVAAWLRRNREWVVAQLHPHAGVDREQPVRAAGQFLAAAALATRRARLPAEADRRIAAVLAPPPEAPPAALSPHWQKAVALLHAQHRQVRQFLLNELSVQQGATGGLNFIDPLPLLRALSGFDDAPAVEIPDELCFGGFWASRYAALEPLMKLEPLDRLAVVERAAVSDAVEEVRRALEAWEYDGPVGAAVQSFVDDVGEVLEAQQRAEVFQASLLFPDLSAKQLPDAAKRWARAAAEAEAVATKGDAVEAFLFDPAPLRELNARLAEAGRYLERVEKVVHEELEDIRFSGDPDEAAAALLATLDAVATAGDAQIAAEVAA